MTPAARPVTYIPHRGESFRRYAVTVARMCSTSPSSLSTEPISARQTLHRRQRWNWPPAERVARIESSPKTTSACSSIVWTRSVPRRAELLHVLMLPDFDRARRRSRLFYANPQLGEPGSPRLVTIRDIVWHRSR